VSAALNHWNAPVEGGSLKYFDRHYNLEGIKILPGEYHVSRSNIVLSTVLGSCVSACIRDPLAGVGGMNHFMLPESEMNAGTGSARYGSYAMEVLLNDLLKNGGQRSRLEAKVFGGANVLRGFTVNQVGSRNAEFVRNYLATERIAIAAEDLGDIYPRKVLYFPKSGKVMLRRLNAVQSGADLSQESAYRKRLDTQKIGGDIELFD
jgi:chemotaxis protein CheD